MSNYIVLTKILLKNSFSSFGSSKKGKSNSTLKNAALGLVILISLLPLASAIGAGVWTAYPSFKAIGQEGLIFGSGLMMISMMVLFFGIFYIMNVFYFSRDVESLLPLPLRPSTIMAAKFTVTLLYEYLTELLLLLPVIVAFGIVSKAGIIYYLYSLIGFLTLPVIPLVYAGIINMILMRMTNISRNRDQFRIIGGMIAMFVAIFANMKMQSLMSSMNDPEQVVALLQQGNNSLLSAMTGVFPANKLLAIALVNTASLKGLVNILLYLGITGLFLALFLTIGELLYFKGLVGISETKSKRKKLNAQQFEKSMVESSAIKSYTIKELKLLFRTPIYFINCVMMNFLWPVFFLIPLLVGSESSIDILQLRDMVRAGTYEGLVLGIAFAAVIFASSTNGITASSISREGSSIFISKYLPVSYHDQIMAKVMSGVLMGIAALLSMLAAVVFIAMPPLYLILLITLAGVLGVIFTSFVGILIDLNFPKLHWDNEQKAVKQNLNVVVHMLTGIAVAAAVLVPTIWLKLNVYVVFGALLVVFGAANAALYGLMKSTGVRLFSKIEA